MAFAITPSQLTDGVIEFAIWTVGGKPAFNASEKDALVEANPQATVAVVTKTAFEIMIASSGIKFVNYSDFKKAVEDKDHLDDKIADTKASDYRKKKLEMDALKVENNKR